MKLALPSASLWTLDAGLEVAGGGIALMPGATADGSADFEDGTLGGYAAGGAGTAVNDGTVSRSGARSLKIPYAIGSANYVWRAIAGNNAHAVYERWFRVSAVPTDAIGVMEFVTAPGVAAYRGPRAVVYFLGGGAVLYFLGPSAKNAGINAAPLPIALDTWYRIRAEVNNAGTLANDGYVIYRVYDAAGAELGGQGCAFVTANLMPAVVYEQFYCASQGVAGALWVDDVSMAHGYSAAGPVAESPWIAVAGNSLASGAPVEIGENARASLRMFAPAGTLAYQYALNNGAYNGAWLAQAALNAALSGAAITDFTSSLRLKAQFTSDGAEECDIAFTGALDANIVAANITPASGAIRQQLVTAVAARLATILIANGYRTDIGAHVEEWDTVPMDRNVETLLLEYRDAEEDRVDETVGGQDMRLPVTIRIRTAGSASLAEMRKMVADVVKAIYVDVTWGGLANDTNQDGPATMVKGQAADTAASAEARFVIEYSVSRGEA